MTWIKLADTFTDHPKVVAAGDQAAWLYVAGLCYCSRHLTDGEIPTSALGRLCGLPRPAKLAARLVDAGLWVTTEAGWVVNDYTEHQRSRNEVESIRERTRVRVAKHRSNAVTNGHVTPPDTEKSADTDSEVTTALARRAPDLLWAAMVACYGFDPDQLTTNERGKLNKHVAQLRHLEADPGQIGPRRQNYRLRYPNAADTFPALVSHWSECEHPPPRQNGKALGSIARLAQAEGVIDA